MDLEILTGLAMAPMENLIQSMPNYVIKITARRKKNGCDHSPSCLPVILDHLFRFVMGDY